MSFRQKSSVAFSVSLIITLGMIAVHGAPEAQNTITTLTQSSLLSNLLTIANFVGDDQFSTADLTTLVDPSTTSAQHYGPFAGTTPDSGTCRNSWAQDTFQRHFTIFHRADSVVVVEQFKDGTFVTSTGASPGACQPPPSAGGMIRGGVTGDFHGYFIVPIPSEISQSSTNSNCDAVTMKSPPYEPCFTSTFINSHFRPPCYPVTCKVTTFFFHYSAGDQDLIVSEWKNASDDRGGNHGDIRSS